MSVLRVYSMAICASLIAVGTALAQDKIKTKKQVYTGKITKLAQDGGPMIKLPSGTETKVARNEVLEVEMEAPAGMAGARAAYANGDFQGVLGAIEKDARAFQGLPAAWVVESLGMVGDALIGLGKKQEAQILYDGISKAYAGSDYAKKAEVGLARLAIDAQAFADAQRRLEAITKDAQSTLVATGPRAELYGSAYLVMGELQERMGKGQDALESYLRIVTLYPASESLVSQAKARALALQQKGVYVK